MVLPGVCQSQYPGGYPVVLVMKLHIERSKNHVWKPLGARDMRRFVKHVLFTEIVLGKNHS